MNHKEEPIYQVLSDQQILTQYPVMDGQNNVSVGPSETCYTVLPSNTLTTDLSYRYDNTNIGLTAPVKSGTPINNVQVWYGNGCVAQTYVQALNDAKVGQLYTSPDQGSGLFDAGAFSTAITVLIVIGALIVGLSIGMLIMRKMNEKTIRRRRRRRS